MSTRQPPAFQERKKRRPGISDGWGDGTPLTYLADRNAQNRNRYAVCGNFVPTLGGSCDEYPFAATYQGGDPASASVADVLEIDNTTAGGRLGNTIQGSRIIDGEEFYAYITP